MQLLYIVNVLLSSSSFHPSLEPLAKLVKRHDAIRVGIYFREYSAHTSRIYIIKATTTAVDLLFYGVRDLCCPLTYARLDRCQYALVSQQTCGFVELSQANTLTNAVIVDNL